MVMIMVRPTKRAGTGNDQFRKRIPADLVPVLRGKTFSVDLPETIAADSPTFPVSVVISSEIAFSLRTSDKSLVIARHAAALRHYEAFLDAASREPQDLSHLQLTALHGSIYTELVTRHEANPPARYRTAVDEGVEEWNELDIWREMIEEADRSILTLTPQGRAAAVSQVKRIVDIEAALAARAIVLSDKSYSDLIEGLPATLWKVHETLSQRSNGNYITDRYANQYPKWDGKPEAEPRVSDGQVRTFDDLFDRWKAESKRAASTIATWRGYLNRFTRFIGHDDPHRVEKIDAQRWKDSLIAEGLKKVSTTYLATFNTLYRFGLANSETTGIARNPFEGVKAKQKAMPGTKRLPFTRAEVAQILAAAKAETLPHLRWIPWLQAQTGARVAEIAQLWGSMIVTDDDGHPCIHFVPAPDGGSLKNEGSERTVPLHPDVIADGFLDFVKKRSGGPLFYGGRKGKTATQLRDDQKHPSKGVSNRVGAWVRGLGIEDPRKAPTHSFRHWYKSEMMRFRVLERLVDKIQGHSDKSDASSYAHGDTAMMLAAISKLDLKALADSAPKAELRE